MRTLSWVLSLICTSVLVCPDVHAEQKKGLIDRGSEWISNKVENAEGNISEIVEGATETAPELLKKMDYFLQVVLPELQEFTEAVEGIDLKNLTALIKAVDLGKTAAAIRTIDAESLAEKLKAFDEYFYPALACLFFLLALLFTQNVFQDNKIDKIVKALDSLKSNPPQSTGQPDFTSEQQRTESAQQRNLETGGDEPERLDSAYFSRLLSEVMANDAHLGFPVRYLENLGAEWNVQDDVRSFSRELEKVVDDEELNRLVDEKLPGMGSLLAEKDFNTAARFPLIEVLVVYYDIRDEEQLFNRIWQVYNLLREQWPFFMSKFDPNKPGWKARLIKHELAKATRNKDKPDGN